MKGADPHFKSTRHLDGDKIPGTLNLPLVQPTFVSIARKFSNNFGAPGRRKHGLSILTKTQASRTILTYYKSHPPDRENCARDAVSPPFSRLYENRITPNRPSLTRSCDFHMQDGWAADKRAEARQKDRWMQRWNQEWMQCGENFARLNLFGND